MGSAASISQPNAVSQYMQRIDSTYEAHKHLQDDFLLKTLIDFIKDTNMSQLSDVSPSLSLDANVDQFLVACGKFSKASGSKGNIERAKAMFAAPGSLLDINSVDEEAWSALHYAAGEGHTRTCEFLIENGANIDALDSYNCTPLWVAAFNDKRDVVKVLLMAGASTSISAKPEGEPMTTAALAARRNRHPGLADLIDSESALREKDPTRLERQLRKEMDVNEFNDSIRMFLDPASKTR
jgi:hypothetical protein